MLSPWLIQAICLRPLSPLTAAACPGWLWVSQKFPSVIQWHINLRKSQPFRKGRHHSKPQYSCSGQHHLTHSYTQFCHFCLRWHEKQRRSECAFLSLYILHFLSTYLDLLCAFSKSHSLSLSCISCLYEHRGLSECTVNGAAARSGSEEQLEQYRLMALETAEASGMNK